MELAIVILAAGQGTRMRSALPKVLHPLAGKPLLAHVISAAKQLSPNSIQVIYGHGGEQVRQQIADADVDWVLQEQQLGTGHAVAQALPALSENQVNQINQTVLILYGDVPLISAETLQSLCEKSQSSGFSLLTAHLDDASGYGRIVRDAESGQVSSIVEEKDATENQCAIREINTGMMAVRMQDLERWVDALEDSNAQGEFYLTDIVAMAVAEGVAVETVTTDFLPEIQGVNNRLQLAELERHYQKMQAEQLLLDGVTLLDPNRFDLRGELTCGQDVSIDIDVIFEGNVKLGNRVKIGSHCVIKDAEIGDDTEIFPHSVIDSAQIGENCRVGPFARVRPGTKLIADVHLGNFVELKNATVERGSKINHLSYVGDSKVGQQVNIGAGVITCNYDGANKHKTVIGDRVFVGSDVQLVAPVSVADGATIGAGSTITKDVPAEELTLSRAKQMTLKGWKRPLKSEKKG